MLFFSGGTVDIFCVHGDEVGYPITEAALQVEDQNGILSVGVVERLPYQVVLGQDLPSLAKLIAKQSHEVKPSCTCESLLAITRSKSKQEHSNPTGGWEELPFFNG